MQGNLASERWNTQEAHTKHEKLPGGKVVLFI